MTELEKAIAIISAASSVEAAVVAERLKSDDAPDTVATEYFEPKYKEQRDQGHKTATMKERKSWEKALKDAGVDDVTAENPAAALAAVQAKLATTGDKALTPEQLLKLKPVVDALNAERLKTETAVETARQEERGKLEKDREAFTKLQTETATRAYVKKLISGPDGLNPNFTPGKEAAQEKRLIDEILASGNFKLDEHGEPQLVDADGALLPGKLGTGVAKVADFVREKTEEVHTLPIAKPREIPAAGNPGGDPGKFEWKHFKGEVPKTTAELTALRGDQSIPLEARKELKAYGEAQGL